MAVSKAELQVIVANHLVGTFEKTTPRTVPLPSDLALGNKAALLEATALFMDLRQSSDITNTFRRQTAAKMLKAYFEGAVRIVRRNQGVIVSFNGDGMLALFIGDSRTTGATRAAMEVDWFIEQVLWPKFDRYFNERSATRGAPLRFSVGFGIDDGDIFAVRVGIRGSNDIAWVGQCTNTAAKLSNVLRHPNNIGITGSAYGRLNASVKFDGSTSKWSGLIPAEFGGVHRKYRTTNYYMPIA